ncbi:ASN_HP2_G0015840.mRNA.1.CDS.1 [Saccharomyces cerevisiae]|nr:BGN_3a_G0016140.mRNA.1.CDS.1 [Saccharomyces cerevisiae]CAI4424782.1 BGP_1a_G0015640.mRNA.1.CDS.1 [Saccharomyces cerevisiae]CAI5283167.1 ASN_HP2_G0015840.mRNA.1.CDS.1 [Saccharomyces cerevisiae]CAI6557703.1 ASN_HP1_G0018930.mRNA.1.CDS.1 [Saccharomyces cerevisiae]CAI6559558.1 ASN_HP2_G0015840.mRNA.1.CDS.1 [Saccharomyces cerevisiae]
MRLHKTFICFSQNKRGCRNILQENLRMIFENKILIMILRQGIFFNISVSTKISF